MPELDKEVGFGGIVELPVTRFEELLGTMVCFALCVIPRVNTKLPMQNINHQPIHFMRMTKGITIEISQANYFTTNVSSREVYIDNYTALLRMHENSSDVIAAISLGENCTPIVASDGFGSRNHVTMSAVQEYFSRPVPWV